ncbi:MFS transporter [Rhodovulum sp. YNF3179]|uniref:MFS transporter n=1 Tax=Rhodovulum sp. YNF3179 TaxID=3425127 RepID=UPI003D32DF74
MNLGALAVPAFRYYFLGAVFAVNAIWFQRIAVAWIAWEISGSAAFVGFVASLSLAPMLVSGPVFGVLVDRADILRASYLTNGAMPLCIAALAALHAADMATPFLLSAIALAIGVIASGHHPVRMSLAPRLVPRARVASVVALSALNFNVARLVAPALAGWVIDRAGVVAALWVAAALYLPILSVLHRLTPRAIGNGAGPRPRFAAAFAEGVAHVWRTPLVRTAVIVTSVFAVAGRGVLEILPVIADGAFGRGAPGLGLISAAAGAGALTAALAKSLGRGEAGGRIPPAVILAAAAGLALVIVLGHTGSWPLALATVAALGFCGTYVGVSLQAAIQAGLSDELRGRVMSLWVMLGFGTVALGALALGAVAEAAGLAVSLTGGGALGLLALVVAVVSADRRLFARR